MVHGEALRNRMCGGGLDHALASGCRARRRHVRDVVGSLRHDGKRARGSRRIRRCGCAGCRGPRRDDVVRGLPRDHGIARCMQQCRHRGWRCVPRRLVNLLRHARDIALRRRRGFSWRVVRFAEAGQARRVGRCSGRARPARDQRFRETRCARRHIAHGSRRDRCGLHRRDGRPRALRYGNRCTGRDRAHRGGKRASCHQRSGERWRSRRGRQQ